MAPRGGRAVAATRGMRPGVGVARAKPGLYTLPQGRAAAGGKDPAAAGGQCRAALRFL